jgi:hypothetical protein
MLQRFGNKSNWSINEKVVRTVLLGPGETPDFAALTALLDRGAQHAATLPEPETKSALTWTRLARAQVAYRSGDFSGAIQQLTSAGPPIDGPNDVGAEGLIVLAMARQKLGDATAAHEALAKARAIVESKASRPEQGWLHEDVNWHHWLRCRLLLREAESLMAKDPIAAATHGTVSAQEQRSCWPC